MQRRGAPAKLAQFIAHPTAHMPTAEAHSSDACMRSCGVAAWSGKWGDEGVGLSSTKGVDAACAQRVS